MKRLSSILVCLFAASLLLAEGESEKIVIDVEKAVEYANNYSRTIKSASIDVDSKTDARNHVLNAFLPDVSFSGTIAKPNEPEEIKAEYYSAIGSAQISLSWGLSIIEKVKKANRDYEAGVLSFEMAIRQNTRDVKKLFYHLLLQQKSLENNKTTLETTKARYDATEKSYRSGNAPRFDVLQSRVTYQNMKRDVDNAEIALERQKREFAVVLGLSPEAKIELSGSLETEIVELDKAKLLETYSAYASDIRSLELQI